jgi:hypothetical protein
MEKNNKVKLYLDLRDEGVVQPDGTYGTQNSKDYFINLNLTRKFKIYDEYVDVQLDPLRVNMQRQLINPWFIEFGFFESITSTGITGETSKNYNVLVPSTQNIVKKAEIFSITINK